MTKPKPIQTNLFEQYQGLDLHQLEAQALHFQSQPPSPVTKTHLRAINQALRSRQQLIKAKAIQFEATNNHHLLFFDSTERYAKLAGHSALFYAYTIAERLHRHFNLRRDTDTYSPSAEGVISFRDLDNLELRLAELEIHPDPKLSTSELHFYKLPRLYSEADIRKFRDRALRDFQRIATTVLPRAVIPDLFRNIQELERLIFYAAKHHSKPSDLHYYQTLLIGPSLGLVSCYLNFAKPPVSLDPSASFVPDDMLDPVAQLRQLLVLVHNLRNNIVTAENLDLVPLAELGKILSSLTEIDRIATREYAKQQRRAQTTPRSRS